MSSASIAEEITICNSQIEQLQIEIAELKKKIERQEDSIFTFEKTAGVFDEEIKNRENAADALVGYENTVVLSLQLGIKTQELFGASAINARDINMEDITTVLKKELEANGDLLEQKKAQLVRLNQNLAELNDDYHHALVQEEEERRAQVAAEAAAAVAARKR